MKFTDEQKQAVAEVCNKLLWEKEENLSDPSDVYAQGYHDALLDVLQAFSIPSDMKHYD